MSEGMEAIFEEVTQADLDGLRQLHVIERLRTEQVVAEVDEGTIVQGEEKREVFSFTAPGEGSWVFDVRSIKDAIASGRISAGMMRLPEVPESFVEHVLTHNGVEPSRLARVSESAAERPGIMVWWGPENGHSTLIDGNHRLLKRRLLGKPDFRFFMVDVVDLKPFMCRPGDENRLFGPERPGYETLHVEIRMESLDE